MKPLALVYSLCLTLFTLSVGTVYATPASQGRLIFPLQSKHVHSSSIVEAPNGDLIAAWFHGSGERNSNDVRIQGARLVKGETNWSPVFEMADTPGLPDCNPTLFVDPQDRLWLFWIVVQANRWEHSQLKFRRSTDFSRPGAPRWTWQDVIHFVPGDSFAQRIRTAFDELKPDESLWAEYAPRYSRMIIAASQDKIKRQTGWMSRIHPLVLSSGRILLPLYSDGFNVSLVGLSDDDGATWRPSLPIVGLGPIQPTLVQKRDGTIVAYMRDSGAAPNRVLFSTSEDDGATWTAARDTDIPNPGSSLEVTRLKDGRWVMIFNDTEHSRRRLALALSDDEGASWKWKRYLDAAETNELGSFSYPSLIQSRDERLQATYSHVRSKGAAIKHVTVDVEWIKGE